MADETKVKRARLCSRCGHLKYANSNYHNCRLVDRKTFTGTFDEFVEREKATEGKEAQTDER